MSEQTPDQTAADHPGVPNLTEGAVSGLDHEELPRKPSTLAGARQQETTDQSDDTAGQVDGGQVQDEHDSGEEPSGDAAQEVEPTASPDNNPDDEDE